MNWKYKDQMEKSEIVTNLKAKSFRKCVHIHQKDIYVHYNWSFNQLCNE